ncbi:MAG TPA: hypothetical protein VFO07_20725 [Roseiflexaceae bacterium]|nr:hypothetical protein [Roseiflexaceae bacterium]
MSHQERERLEKLIQTHRRRLNVLEQQAAVFGINAPPHVLIEMQDTREQIENLNSELAKLDASVGSQAAPSADVPSLNLQQRQRLVELLLATPSMADRSVRDSLLIQLPPALQHAIPRSSNSRVDVFNIVNTVLNYEGGYKL